jgi:hypothetical protein
MRVASFVRRGTLLGLLTVATLPFAAACATTSFVSTWKAPDAQPLRPEGSRVVAVVMNRNEAARRAAEDALARELTRRGAEGIASYTLIADATPGNEAEARAAFEKAGATGVVVMRPTGTRQELSVYRSGGAYAAPYYRGFWAGGYYGYGWGSAWPATTEVRTSTIVSIETLVYSLGQNKLVWAGQSQTTDPSELDGLVRSIVAAAANELRKEGLL